MGYTYSASAEIREVCRAIGNTHPRIAIRANRWGGIDFDHTCHGEPRVRLAVEDEEGAISLHVFNADGLNAASAQFSNMPAAVITGVVGAYLA